MEEVIVEVGPLNSPNNLGPISPRGKEWEGQMNAWKERIDNWGDEGGCVSPRARKSCKEAWKRHQREGCSSPRSRKKLEEWKASFSPEARRIKAESRVVKRQGEQLHQSCISKPYLNLGDALLLDRRTLENVEILTSPSAVFIDVEKVLEHFPCLKAGYNIFIRVNEHNAPLVRELDLTYALFVLDPLAPELTLTSLIPHLRHDGYYIFFYCKGLIAVNGDTLVVKEAEIPENLVKLVRSPAEYPCKTEGWYNGTWKVYAVNLNTAQARCVDALANEGVIKLEHVQIKNEGKMFYGDWLLRQFVEALVLSLRSSQMPVFVLSGIGSVPLIETIIYVYAQENGLVTDDQKIRVDYMIESWIGDDLPDKVVSMGHIKEVIHRHRSPTGHYHKLMLHDPLIVRLIKEEQDLFAFGKVFSHEGVYKPELLE